MHQDELSSAEKRSALFSALILSAVDDNEPFGVMGSELFNIANGIGCPLDCFTATIEALVAQGILERHGSCYCRSTRLSGNAEMSLAE
jgi:hypothetical protein